MTSEAFSQLDVTGYSLPLFFGMGRLPAGTSPKTCLQHCKTQGPGVRSASWIMHLPLSLALALIGAWLSYADLYAAVPTAVAFPAVVAATTATSLTAPASVTHPSRPTVSDVNYPGQTAWTVPDDTLAASAVTGDRNPSASSSSPSSRLGRDRIEKSGMAALQEALKTFAGVSIRDYGGIGGLKTVNIRNF